MVPHQYQHSTCANEVGGSPVQGQLELQNETVSLNKRKEESRQCSAPRFVVKGGAGIS